MTQTAFESTPAHNYYEDPPTGAATLDELESTGAFSQEDMREVATTDDYFTDPVVTLPNSYFNLSQQTTTEQAEIPRSNLAWSQTAHGAAWSELQEEERYILSYGPDGQPVYGTPGEGVIDTYKEKIKDAKNADEAFELYQEVHDTDPIHAINILEVISDTFGTASDNKIDTLAVETVSDARMVILGDKDSATPEDGLNSIVTAVDLVKDKRVKDGLIDELDEIVKEAEHIEASAGHRVPDQLLTEAISDAISILRDAPDTQDMELGELVKLHIEDRELNAEQEAIHALITAQEAKLAAIVSRRDQLAPHLVHEKHPQRRVGAGIRGLISGLVSRP